MSWCPFWSHLVLCVHRTAPSEQSSMFASSCVERCPLSTKPSQLVRSSRLIKSPGRTRYRCTAHSLLCPADVCAKCGIQHGHVGLKLYNSLATRCCHVLLADNQWRFTASVSTCYACPLQPHRPLTHKCSENGMLIRSNDNAIRVLSTFRFPPSRQ